ncbi:MAG: hypothetical protein ACXQS8_08970 [Candidatus Helarchaeales archaeon]
MKKQYEKIQIKPEHRTIIRTFIRLIDPLNLPRLIFDAMTSDRFFLDEAFYEHRERLRHFFDNFVPVKFEEISDAIYLRLVKILNHLFGKSYEFEIDVDGVKRLIIKLYPNRKIIQDHKLVLDTLAEL